MAAKCLSANEIVQHIKSGHRVFIHGGAAAPTVLLRALVENSSLLKGVELIHLHTEDPALYCDPRYKDIFRVTNLFVGENIRPHIDFDRIDYLPCFLSEIPKLFLSKRKPIDIAVLHLSPPDNNGYCTLGTSVDVARAAFESADLILAQINDKMPRVHGDGLIHIKDVDFYIEVSQPLPERHCKDISESEDSIGRSVSGLVDDGSCLQVGIGAIPDAVLRHLKKHKHLGVHTEMWSDGMLDLLNSGAIDNSKKNVHAGKTVSSFIIGSKKVYDYINDNPAIVQFGSDYVNNPTVIGRNPNVCAINSAVEIDLTGQVCADSVGSKIISGVGGQMDFMRGASISQNGKPIIAMTSRTKNGRSRIVSTLKEGAGVVTTRAHVHFIVTEYGIADLFGKTLGERARALINISHPEDRNALEKAWHDRRKTL